MFQVGVWANQLYQLCCEESQRPQNYCLQNELCTITPFRIVEDAGYVSRRVFKILNPTRIYLNFSHLLVYFLNGQLSLN